MGDEAKRSSTSNFGDAAKRSSTSSGGDAAGLRVGDAERSAVATRLSEAHAEGRLTLGEFDERVRDAWAARTAAELAPLTSDLPAPSPVAAPVPRVRRGDAGLRAAVAVWAAVSVLNLAIWLAVAVGTGAPVYPWWVWVAGPWGMMLAVRALSGRTAGVPMPCGALPGPRRR
jgi:hypothetical protein